MNKRVLKLYKERNNMMQKSENTGRTEIKTVKQYGLVTDSVAAKNNGYHFRYYATLICAIDEDKRTICFNTDGWHTKTTKERINAICSLVGLQKQLHIKNGLLVWENGVNFIDYETFTF